MKKNVKFLVLLLCAILIGNLAGCNSVDSKNQEEMSPVHAVLIVQAVSTVPVVNLDSVRDLTEKVCSIPGSTISIIVADGQPWIYASVTPDAIDTSLSETMKAQILEERVQELAVIAASAEAVNPESDLRGAIEKGARELQSYQDGDKELMICGSCINTVQPIAMQEMPLSIMDIDAVIQKLIDESYTVDLNGINVSVFNLGDTCGIQKELLNKDKTILQEFWEAFLRAGNPADICFYDNLPSGFSYENLSDEELPEMSTVPVVETGSALITKEEMEAVSAISFDEQGIAFEPGTANLLDPDAAAGAISAAAEYMKKSNINALLVGTTAQWGELPDSIRLSYERAQAVEELFVNAGVDEKNLTVIGTGWLSCFYKNDGTADGGLDESIAPSNRTCTWVNASCQLAGRIWGDEDFPEFLVEN